MNPFLGNDSKSAIAVILRNAEKGSDKESEKEVDSSDSIEDPREAAAAAIISAITNRQPKKLVKAFEVLLDMCQSIDMDDEEME